MSNADFVPFDLGTVAPVAPAPDRNSRAIADPPAIADGFEDWGKGAGFRAFQRSRQATIATIATIAGIAGIAGIADPEAPVLPWQAGIDLLQTLPVPEWMQAEAWEDLVWTAVKVSRDWGSEAVRLGWNEVDLFGCHVTPRCTNNGCDGLATLLARMRSPLKIIGLAEDHAVLHDLHANILRYRRSERSTASLLWRAYAFKAGP